VLLLVLTPFVLIGGYQLSKELMARNSVHKSSRSWFGNNVSCPSKIECGLCLMACWLDTGSHYPNTNKRRFLHALATFDL